MNVVMIIPTGIGCEIGGHCGDGNAAARLLGACCDTLILHPNVVNASDLNEMPSNSLYVEGRDGVATGEVLNWKELVEQVRDLEFDALGLATPITIDAQTLADYFQHGGVNPVGGVEAVASKLIADALDKPVAHGPVDYALNGFTQVVDPRMAVEIITENFIHCLLKGLHQSPRSSYESGLSVRDVDCMVSPYGCFGTPHQACFEARIPVIVVRENRSCLDVPEHPEFQNVENYLEAAGTLMAMQAGVHPASVRRPLKPTVVK